MNSPKRQKLLFTEISSSITEGQGVYIGEREIDLTSKEFDLWNCFYIIQQGDIQPGCAS